jgi:biopolymer transport protein ExbD
MSGTTNIGGGGPPGDISFNYVPLIDVTFNLIIFFVLTSEIGIAQKARVLMPDPYEPQAVKRGAMSTNSVVIAVISAAAYESNAASSETASRALKYELDGQEFRISDLDDLVGMIAKKKDSYDKIAGVAAAKGEFFVEIRADARVHFSEIRPVIEAIARAKIPKMAITARKAA